MVKHCPHCGSQASDAAVFCRICGKKIKEEVDTGKDSEVVRSLEKEIDDLIAETKPKKEQEKIISELKKEEKPPVQPESEPQKVETPRYFEYPIEMAIEQYIIRDKLEKINDKLLLAKKKIDKFLDRIEKEGEELTEDEIDDLKNIIKKIKDKKKELLDKKQPLPFNENIASQIEDMKDKINQVKNKFHTKKITKIAYDNLYNEYEGKLKELEGQIPHKKQFEKNLRKQLVLRKKELTDKSEIDRAKVEIGELSKEKFEELQDKIKQEIEDIEFVVKQLK